MRGRVTHEGGAPAGPMMDDEPLPDIQVTPPARRTTLGRWSVLLLGIGLSAVLAATAFVTGILSFGAVPKLVVLGLVVVVVLRALWHLLRRRWAATPLVRPPPVDTRERCARPGAIVDADVRDADGDSEAERNGSRLRLRRRLRPLATAILADREGWDEATAPARLAAGDWTDDPLAAAMFAEDEASSGWRLRLRAALGVPASYATRVHACLQALEREAGREPATDLALGMAAPSREKGNWAEGVWRTGYWTGIGGVALLLVAGGVVTSTEALVLAGAVCFALGGYARVVDPPDPSLAVTRTFDPPDPNPGETVAVSVRVSNEGDRPLADLRLVDRVPDHLAVTDGSPAHGAFLWPGASTTFEYTVLATAGEHPFDASYAMVRDPSGEAERTLTVATDANVLVCEPGSVAGDVPLHPKTLTVAGRVRAESGGEGVEFHDLREYRQGDPLKRVDWNTLARRGDLATRRFHQEQAASVVLVVDVRPAADLAPTTDSPTAIDRSLSGARALLETLTDDGDRVGIATMGVSRRWLPPRKGRTHLATARDILAHSRDGETDGRSPAIDADQYRRELGTRLPSDAQVVLLSPLADETPVAVAEWLQANRYPVTVLSPDPTGPDTVGSRVLRLERDRRFDRLRHLGARVIEWPRGESVAQAIDRSKGGPAT